MSDRLDFVIPLEKPSIIFDAVVQALDRLHSPRRIIVVTDLDRVEARDHGVGTPVEYVDEKRFFGDGDLSRTAMERFFDDAIRRNPLDPAQFRNHAKFGWWYQQLLKLGAGTVIDGLSDYYVVWDADLVPFVKWATYATDGATGEGYACTAVLQEQPNSEFYRDQYALSIRDLVGMDPLFPVEGDHPVREASAEYSVGTFVTHHMVLRRPYVRELLDLVVDVAAGDRTATPKAPHDALWQYVILRQSSRSLFFSEYQTYQTYCLTRAKADNRYYPYRMFGSGKARFPDGGAFLDRLGATHDLRTPPTYDQIVSFVARETGEHEGALFEEPISHLLVDRV